jgi:hypothetical protein
MPHYVATPDAIAAMEQLQKEWPRTLTSPLPSECKVIFVVPLYDETPQRFLTLLQSLADQVTSVNTVGVIAVVNNRPDDKSAEWRQAFKRNQDVLDLPIYENRSSTHETSETPQFSRIRENLTVYAIDHSSPGSWVEDSNVGRARRHGLNEAALLFYSDQRNGLVVHTDADCRFDDPLFISKTLWLFRQDPTMMGVAGVSTPELDMNDPEGREIATNLQTYLLYRRYRSLSKSVRAAKVDFDPEKTLGRCIIHLAFEGIASGGIAPINLAEDLDFGNKLKTYASCHGMHFAHAGRWNLGPISALRVSDRTPNNIRQIFLSHAEADGQMRVEDVFHPGQTVLLTEAYLEQIVHAVRNLPGGSAQLEYVFVTSPLANLRIRRA